MAVGCLAAGFAGGCAAAGAAGGLIVIGLPTFGFTTKGFGPALPLLPSAGRFGPEPAGGNGVLPTGRAAACGPAGRCSSAAARAASAAFCPSRPVAGGGGTGSGIGSPRFGSRSFAAGFTPCSTRFTVAPCRFARHSMPNWCSSEANSPAAFLGTTRSRPTTLPESYSCCVMIPARNRAVSAPLSSGIMCPPSPVATTYWITNGGTP